jgi:hypothetical protein
MDSDSQSLELRVRYSCILDRGCICTIALLLTALMLAEKHWSSDLKKEVAELKECFKDVSVELERPAPLYLRHYTKWDILCKMLQGQSIRLYDVLSMTDQEEFLYPHRIIRESMEHYWGKPLLHVTDFFLARRLTQIRSICAPFASCFCEAAETRYMWTEYGDQGKVFPSNAERPL